MQNENLSPVGKFFRNKWVWLVGVVDLLIIIVIVVMIIGKAAETAKISFNIAPIDVNITINGSGGYKNTGQALDKNKNAGQTYSFAPGTYEIQISHPDLDTKTFVVDLEPNSNTTITTFLSKDGNFDFYTLRDNLGSFDRLASMASAGDNRTTDNDTSAESFIVKFQRDYEKYVNDLPVTYSEYDENRRLTKYITIRADSNCMVTLCLKATLFDENDRYRVEEMLREKGFEVEDFEIEYNIK